MRSLRPAILLALLLAVPAAAQEQDPADIAHTKIVSVKAEPATAKVGETFTLVFKVEVLPEWHIYSANGTYTPTEWEFAKGIPLERAGKVFEPHPKHHRQVFGKDDDGKDIVVEYDYHEGEATFRVPVKLTAAAKPGPLKISGKMTGQECDPKVCVPMDVAFSTDVTVAEAKVAAPQDEDPASVVHTKILSTAAEPATAKAGETIRLVFKVRVDPGWHIYSANGTYAPTVWEFAKGIPLVRAGRVDEPKPKRNEEHDILEGEITFRVPVRLTAGAKPGPLKIDGAMKGQECDPRICIPIDLPFSTSLAVAEGGVAVPAPPPPSPPDGADDPATAGWGMIIFWAVLGGLISLIMPCVYPLLPITLTYFIKQGGESRAKSVAMSSAYAMGIIIVFTGIGFLFSVLLGADGPRIFAANPWVNMAVGLLFFWFAFSLFGLYEINLPSWVTGSLANKQRSGVGGAFILGSLFSVVTFTCTIPFAANILTVAASSGAGNKFAGLVGMLIYSATMAAPFFVLGIFPSLLKEVPKSGGWLHTVKVTAAFGELALALMYFAKADQVTETGILTRSVMIAVWVAVLAVMALYLLGFFRMKEDGPPGPVGLPRTLIALAFGALAVYMSSGFSGQALGTVDFLLPARAAEGFQNYDEALAEAKRSGKPLFVEFTGYT